MQIYPKKEQRIQQVAKALRNNLKKRNFRCTKKYIMMPTSLFSGIKYGDYLFLNKKFF